MTDDDPPPDLARLHEAYEAAMALWLYCDIGNGPDATRAYERTRPPAAAFRDAFIAAVPAGERRVFGGREYWHENDGHLRCDRTGPNREGRA